MTDTHPMTPRTPGHGLRLLGAAALALGLAAASPTHATAPRPAPIDLTHPLVAPTSEIDTELIRTTLDEVFAAALDADFDRYAALVHPSEKATPAQLAQLQRFTFGRFVRQARWYLGDASSPSSYVIERIEDLGAKKLRIFLKNIAHVSRPAAPITVESTASAMVILSNSL